MELPERILSHLSKENSLQSLKLSQKWDLDHQKIVGAIKSLEALGDVVKTVQDTITRYGTKNI
jgi:phenylalanyl-tRNA synthetase alpha chain